MGADDLQEMVKNAVKEALDEQKADEGGDGGGDPAAGGDPDLGEILDAAVEAVNAKRKAAKADEDVYKRQHETLPPEIDI